METFFLACFAFGLLFTIVSFAMGAVGSLHFGHAVGHGPGHGGGHIHTGHVHGGHIDSAHAHAGQEHASHEPHLPHDSTSRTSTPLLNASSFVGGLTWFGAAGYLLTRFLGEVAVAGIIVGALAAGALGWYLIARFLGLVLKGEVEMDPEDYRLEGTLGRVTVTIPAGGTGEVLFEKVGVRRSEAARGLAGAAIARGTEVVITAYADGFATVQPWSEFIADRDQRKLAAPAQNREA